jgi:hypothetical protein
MLSVVDASSIDRRPTPGALVHNDHASQSVHVLGIWPTSTLRQAASVPRQGGDAFDNAAVESFCARMQTEFLDTKA